MSPLCRGQESFYTVILTGTKLINQSINQSIFDFETSRLLSVLVFSFSPRSIICQQCSFVGKWSRLKKQTCLKCEFSIDAVAMGAAAKLHSRNAPITARTNACFPSACYKKRVKCIPFIFIFKHQHNIYNENLCYCVLACVFVDMVSECLLFPGYGCIHGTLNLVFTQSVNFISVC